MRVCQLELRGFRGIREARLSFPQHCALCGANNAGKMIIVETVALLCMD